MQDIVHWTVLYTHCCLYSVMYIDVLHQARSTAHTSQIWILSTFRLPAHFVLNKNMHFRERNQDPTDGKHGSWCNKDVTVMCLIFWKWWFLKKSTSFIVLFDIFRKKFLLERNLSEWGMMYQDLRVQLMKNWFAPYAAQF